MVLIVDHIEIVVFNAMHVLIHVCQAIDYSGDFRCN